jgi:hypothetical protein
VKDKPPTLSIFGGTTPTLAPFYERNLSVIRRIFSRNMIRKPKGKLIITHEDEEDVDNVVPKGV